jgi:hypothetical protein
LEQELWHPSEPRRKIRGWDIKKMITQRLAYVDSRSEILIQAVDILASFLRRLLSREIEGNDIAHALGRLQIIKQQHGTPQSLQVLTISQKGGGGRSDLFKAVRSMTQAGRSMMAAERTLSRKQSRSTA